MWTSVAEGKSGEVACWLPTLSSLIHPICWIRDHEVDLGTVEEEALGVWKSRRLTMVEWKR